MHADDLSRAKVHGTELPSEWTDRHARTVWAHCVNLVLAVWLVSAPATLGYGSEALAWSDLLSGVLILLFAGFCLSRAACGLRGRRAESVSGCCWRRCCSGRPRRRRKPTTRLWGRS